MEVFNIEAIEQHIARMKISESHESPLGKGAGLGSMYGLAMNGSMLPDFDDPNACCVCGLTRLTFEPPAVYCTSCAQRIKRNHVSPSPPRTSCARSCRWRYTRSDRSGRGASTGNFITACATLLVMPCLHTE